MHRGAGAPMERPVERGQAGDETGVGACSRRGGDSNRQR